MGAAFFLGEWETVIANFEMDGFLHTLFLGTETQADSEKKCLQQCFCRKGETNLCDCVTLQFFPKK